MARDELAGLLFELASPERLAILDAIRSRPAKHSEIARSLSLTGSEATRHLNRLTAAGLVTRNARGEFEPTGLALAVGRGLPFLDYLTAHREYLRGHDVLVLDPPFVARLGELARTGFTRGAYDVVAAQETMAREAKERIWVMSEARFEKAIPILQRSARRGVDVRVIRPGRAVEREARGSLAADRGYPLRTLERTHLFLAVADGQAAVCFPSLRGDVDLTTMIMIRDPAGLRWAEDLFGRYWKEAREEPAPPPPSLPRSEPLRSPRAPRAPGPVPAAPEAGTVPE